MLKRVPVHIFFRFLSIIWIALLASCAASKYKINKTPLTSFFETNPVFRESHSGLIVFDPVDGKNIFEYNAHKHFTPASNTKLLTFYAAKKMAGDSIPALKYAVIGDSLFFTGTGDPTFLYNHFGYSHTFDFTDTSSHSLVYVERPMSDQRLGPGWAWDDYRYYYSPEKSTFPIYGNVVQFKKEQGRKTISVVPKSFEKLFFAKSDSAAEELTLTRSEFENLFYADFPDTSEFDESVPFIYTPETFINLLTDTLHKPITFAEQMPETSPIRAIYSVPTDSVLKYILRDSDNFLAEQMLLVISGELGDTLSSEKTIDFMTDYYFCDLKNQIHWIDGSGLSRYNLVTPLALTIVLSELYAEIPKEKLYYLLPESSETGTLKSSFPLLEGRIHAKTGSMSHVYNLSGYLETNSGKTLIFSFMNNNFNVSFSELKKEMERVLMVFVNSVK